MTVIGSVAATIEYNEATELCHVMIYDLTKSGKGSAILYQSKDNMKKRDVDSVDSSDSMDEYNNRTHGGTKKHMGGSGNEKSDNIAGLDQCDPITDIQWNEGCGALAYLVEMKNGQWSSIWLVHK